MLQCRVYRILDNKTLRPQKPQHWLGKRVGGVTNIMDGGRVNLTAVKVRTPGSHTSNYVGVGVVHMYLNKPRWRVAALVIGNEEGNIRRSPVVFVTYWRLRLLVLYGCALES